MRRGWEHRPNAAATWQGEVYPTGRGLSPGQTGPPAAGQALVACCSWSKISIYPSSLESLVPRKLPTGNWVLMGAARIALDTSQLLITVLFSRRDPQHPQGPLGWETSWHGWEREEGRKQGTMPTPHICAGTPLACWFHSVSF